MSTIAVKKVNNELYRKVKALASLRGRTVSEAVNEALALWVRSTAKDMSDTMGVRLEEETRQNNDAYEREESNLLAKHRGEYVAVGGGRILGTFAKPEYAYAAVREAGLRQAIVTRIEEKPKKLVGLGWSVMEQLA